MVILDVANCDYTQEVADLLTREIIVWKSFTNEHEYIN